MKTRYPRNRSAALWAVGIVLLTALASHASLLTDLEVHYTFDQDALISGSGGVFDNSGNGNSATLVNGVSSVDGMIDGASRHTPTTTPATVAYIAADDLTVGNFSGGSFSMSIWFKTDNIYRSSQGLVTKARSSSGAQGWGLLVHGNANDDLTRLMFVGTDKATSTSYQFNYDDVTLASDTWYHVAFTYDTDSGEFTLFLNGESQGAYTLGNLSANFDVLAPLTLGASVATDGAVTRAYSGLLDDFGLWSRALTEAEIQQIYTQGMSGHAIPEPSVALALLSGALLLGGFRRFRAIRVPALVAMAIPLLGGAVPSAKAEEIPVQQEDVEVQSGTEVEFPVEIPEVPVDQELVLELTAWHPAPKSAGYYASLRVFLGETELEETLDRPAEFLVSRNKDSGATYPIRKGKWWMVPVYISPDDRNSPNPYAVVTDGLDIARFRFRLPEMSVGKNRLRIMNKAMEEVHPTGGYQVFSTLQIREVVLRLQERKGY